MVHSMLCSIFVTEEERKVDVVNINLNANQREQGVSERGRGV
jgi:hypothetical protein